MSSNLIETSNNLNNMIDKKKAYLDLGYKFKLICDHKEMSV